MGIATEQEIISLKLVEGLRAKADKLLKAADSSWSAETLQSMLGEAAGYMQGIADGIEYQMLVQENKRLCNG